MLLLSPAVVKALMGMPKRERAQLKARLDAIAAKPDAPHASVAALQGEPRGRFRVRQGDYRAVFRIDGEDVVVSFSGVPNPTPQVRFVYNYVVLK